MNRYTEVMNYAQDSRVTARHQEVPELDGEPLPHTWVVCDLCGGRGTHVNPAIDADGLGPEEFADDPEFARDYFDGAYDQTCNQCHGRTTVPQVDVSRCTFAQKRVLAAERREARDEAEYQRECAYERAMGC